MFKRLLSTARECLLETNNKIAVLTLNRPQQKNALGRQMIREFREHLQTLKHSDARVLIVRSAVDKVFCAGADLKERQQMTQSEVNVFVDSLRAGFSELELLPIPTIAVLDGFALGGGLEMALACDIRVSGPDAKMGLVETKLAIIPGAGGTQRLPRLIGPSKAKELIFTAKVLNAQEALEYGIVNHVGNASQLAYDMAQEIAKKGPIAVKMAKIAVHKGIECDTHTGMILEQQCYAQVIPTKDRLEGLQAFKEKRDPHYTGN
ncbi:ClpP/crotonase-like domain-containing protein [Gorgonomyces haynaldii]|nr:ClpP/crotonase-like domain-containing protein [Gorgonomyces haynaldii]